MIYRGQVQNGVVVFIDPIPLPEGTEVRVEPVTLPSSSVPEPSASPSASAGAAVIGSIKDLPSDAAENLDHYLYGHPRQSNATHPGQGNAAQG